MALVLITGPHGTGKDTLIDALVRSSPRFERVRRHITRPRQPHEAKTDSYHYVTQSDFETSIRYGKFAEWASQPDSSSGTAWADLEMVTGNKVGLVAINPDDALTLRKAISDAALDGTTCFVSPVSRRSFLESEDDYLAELRRRMVARGRQTDHIERRLTDAARFRRLELLQPSSYFVANRRGRSREALGHLASICGKFADKATDYAP